MAKEKILIVDDEEDILELLRFNLSREGYHLVTATTGEEALDLSRSEVPDLILLDLMLPGIDGLEVAKLLKVDAGSKTGGFQPWQQFGPHPGSVLAAVGDKYVVPVFLNLIVH